MEMLADAGYTYLFILGILRPLRADNVEVRFFVSI
jgi:hypothetical protein